MTSITVEFEFEIGDLVFFRAAQHIDGHRPLAHTITERYAQECSGGIQKLYRLCGCEDFVAEISLSKEEPPYRPPTKDWTYARMSRIVDDMVAGYRATANISKLKTAEREAKDKQQQTQES